MRNAVPYISGIVFRISNLKLRWRSRLRGVPRMFKEDVLMNKLLTIASKIPVPEERPFQSVAPVFLPGSSRVVDLEMRVSAPVRGNDLPLILLSHGHGASNYLSSSKGCLPLAEFWASHGFVVIQPTHLNSPTISPETTEAPLFWRSRVEDMVHILDHLDAIEGMVPGLAGRIDRRKIAVAGYSMGGHTASMLLGMRMHDVEGLEVIDLRDERIKCGVVLAGPGVGADMDGPFAERYPDLGKNSFEAMTTPALIVVGENDHNPNFSSRPSWRSDPYVRSPGPKSLFVLKGAEHGLGGIAGYDAKETTDENPDRAAAVQRMTLAYLTSSFDPSSDAWANACTALEGDAAELGRTEAK